MSDKTGKDKKLPVKKEKSLGGIGGLRPGLKDSEGKSPEEEED